MMVSASPMMKPLRTGSEIQLARKPSRRTPARRASTPVANASATVNAANCSGSADGPPVTRSATAAAESAAVAAIGPVIRCRELPNTA